MLLLGHAMQQSVKYDEKYLICKWMVNYSF